MADVITSTFWPDALDWMQQLAALNAVGFDDTTGHGVAVADSGHNQ
jgi:hypothetical protein